MPKPLLALALLVAAPAAAQAPLQTLIGSIGAPDASGALPVEIVLLNGGDAATTAHPPSRFAADVQVGETHSAASLERAPGEEPNAAVPARGFVRVRYRLVLPATAALPVQAILSVPGAVGPVAFNLATASARMASAETPPPVPVVKQTFGSASADTGNAFLRSLSAYQPIYAVYGPGTDTDARLQFSFKYQLFGAGGLLGTRASVLDGLYLGYTQRMFWDLSAPSSPLRDVDYMPELFYLVPAKVKVYGAAIGGQAGFLHESNGRDGVTSRSLNTLYAQAVATLPIGDYKLAVGPRLWAFVGKRSENPAIQHYRGNTGLFAEIGRDDGLRLRTTSRYNFQSGKGAIDAELSYPISEIVHGVNLYLFAQGFTGYGENLLDYRRETTRLRGGLAIVR